MTHLYYYTIYTYDHTFKDNYRVKISHRSSHHLMCNHTSICIIELRHTNK